MTYEEAIKGLQKKICCEGTYRTDKTYHFCTDVCMYKREYCEVALALNALEKQIPKKPNSIYLDNKLICGECIICGNRIAKVKYCPSCGQAVDWSDK